MVTETLSIKLKNKSLKYFSEHGAVIYISKKNIVYNSNIILKKCINQIISPVIKSDAYGVSAKSLINILLIFVEVNPEWVPELGHNTLQEKFEAEELLGVIDELPVGYRTVFNLFAIEGYAHKEIGEMLGVSESTSKSQLNKARGYLKERINQQQYLSKS